jgi:hypothetical protein
MLYAHIDGGNHSPSSLATFQLNPKADEKALLRKIDFKLMPILFCSYFLQFLDKVIYNVSFNASVTEE